MSAYALVRQGVGLDDKYVADRGEVLLSGIQALVRLTLEQRRLDRLRGIDTRVFVSGYPGSPLGGVDRELQRAQEHLEPAGIVFRPAVNEELAATAVAGTQLLGELPNRRCEGVAGFWFGKNPGLDRAADAIRHGNVSGTAALGGAVAWIGDDPGAKSSTIPSSCEPMCRSLAMPLLFPGSVDEVVELGLHAVALSRLAGLWTGMKIVADVADASATVTLGAARDAIPTPDRVTRRRPPILLAPSCLDAEHDLLSSRLALARGYAREAGLNRITFEPRRARLAIIAAGATYETLVRALADLGLEGDDRQRLGLRLIKLAMPWPLDPEELRRTLHGVEEVLVLEDKLPFVESQVKEALYREPHAPLVVGTEDQAGRPLLTARGTVGADEIAIAVSERLERLDGERFPTHARERLARIIERRERSLDGPRITVRTPYFCSGCPHSTSTKAADDKLVGVGIGCHIMVVLDEGGRGRLLGMPQMGGEGAQWMGLAPFTADEHFVQNLGDGTFHHSGSLAIRGAVAAGVNVTYKLLYNDAVAMTGGQRPEGRLDVPDLTRWLAIEGVRRVIVTTDDPAGYRGIRLDPIAEVRHRDAFAGAEAELAAIPGVTVLVHDDRCATEERRLRKRGKLPTPQQRVWINERVCEGCGDCGQQSTCLSVLPVETELGRKTQIHQSSCNQDLACLQGDCPSFVLVTPGRTKARSFELPVELPDPRLRVADSVLVHMPGVGGTGVVTVSQILQMAAHLAGRHAAGLEQTGLAQKGGPVVSDLRISGDPITGALRATAGSADVLLGFDLLGASGPRTLAIADPGRTVAIVNTAVVPTAAMITGTATALQSTRQALEAIGRSTRAAENVYVDAQRIAERIFNDHMPANMVLVGAAYQHGCLPLPAEAIEQAIRLNDTAVDVNLAAFRWGRAAVADPASVEAAIAGASVSTVSREHPRAAAIVERCGADSELLRLLKLRVSDLIDYQDEAYAARYADSVARVAAVERERAPAEGAPLAEAYARGLHKLMAYKDEYEVARLHLHSAERARLAAEFGEGAKVQILLHPPLLRALGLKRKLRLGPWVLPFLRALRSARRLRGTPLDPFGRAKVRRVERELIEEYECAIDSGLVHLTPAALPRLVRLAALPDIVRGYEEIKLANIAAFRLRLETLSAKLA